MECQMGGICGTLRLGLGEEKWMDSHWESHVLHIFLSKGGSSVEISGAELEGA